FKYAFQDGERTLMQVKADVTDDRGEYRLFWLPPGLYYIGAEPQGGRIGPAMIVMAEGAGGRMIRADSDNARSTADKLGAADVVARIRDSSGSAGFLLCGFNIPCKYGRRLLQDHRRAHTGRYKQRRCGSSNCRALAGNGHTRNRADRRRAGCRRQQ